MNNRSPFELSRLLGWGLAGAILVFTGGILAGLKIADLRNLERNLVKYPDGDRTRSFANVGNPEKTRRQANPEREASDEPGSAATAEPSTQAESAPQTKNPAPKGTPATLIIRIGAWRPARAGELARSLNSIPELASIPFQPCKGIADLNPGRSQVFPVPSDDRKTHRLFAGCYKTPEDARKALDAIHHTGVAVLKDAKVYELSD